VLPLKITAAFVVVTLEIVAVFDVAPVPIEIVPDWIDLIAPAAKSTTLQLTIRALEASDVFLVAVTVVLFVSVSPANSVAKSIDETAPSVPP
jgi:ribose 5-phosphate isomerase